MSRPAPIHHRVFVSLTLVGLGAAWWGCATAAPTTTTTTTTTSSSSSGSSGSTGTGGTGGMDIHLDGGEGGGDAAPCTSTSAEAHRIPLDIIFLIDQSGSMNGPKWTGTSAALTTFFNDPASANIGAGLLFFPNHGPPQPACNTVDYETLVVPIDVLPLNAFALTNALPAKVITGGGTPTYGALQGTLMAATAYQDAHPTHKVVVVLATDGDPNICPDNSIDDVAALAKSARDYNGVLTYVIGVEGSSIPNLNKIAVAGGTGAAYDVTVDISQFSATMAQIRKGALGCDFAIPPPPNSQQLDPNEVNFTYTPKGVGMPKILLRSDNLVDCNDKPGWYYDNDADPTKIILCPASCSTVQADNSAKVSVLFGCKSLIN